MESVRSDCLLCDGEAAAAQLDRVIVWEDDVWRLSMSRHPYTGGFGYLEPKRHVPHITDLDGAEAATLGPTLARVTSALKQAAEAELVYVYVFGGGIPHLHLHLAPHRDGDALSEAIIRGEQRMEHLPSGAGRIVSAEFERMPAEEAATIAERARDLLAGG